MRATIQLRKILEESGGFSPLNKATILVELAKAEALSDISDAIDRLGNSVDTSAIETGEIAKAINNVGLDIDGVAKALSNR